MGIRDALIDELLEGQDPATVMRQDGLLGALKQALLKDRKSTRLNSSHRT